MALTRSEAIDKAEEVLAKGRSAANSNTTAPTASACAELGQAYVELAKLADDAPAP